MWRGLSRTTVPIAGGEEEMLAPSVTYLLPGGHRQPPYLFEDFQQCDATGIGAVDDTLRVLEAEAHHSWVNYCGGDAAEAKV